MYKTFFFMYKTSQMPLVHCLCINTLYVIDVTPYVLADVIAYVQHFFISYIHNYSNASGTLRIYQHSVCHRRYSLCITRRYCLCIHFFFFWRIKLLKCLWYTAHLSTLCMSKTLFPMYN